MSLLIVVITWFFAITHIACGDAVVYGDDSIMNQKAHGTCVGEPNRLRWQVHKAIANHLGCFNRQMAEYAGYFKDTRFLHQTVLFLLQCT